MRTHNRIWFAIIAAGWALVMLTASVTGNFQHRPMWPDLRGQQMSAAFPRRE